MVLEQRHKRIATVAALMFVADAAFSSFALRVFNLCGYTIFYGTSKKK
jgi:hypothetical protein